MSLKNDTFGFTRNWLVTALKQLPVQPDLFSKKSMSAARKSFLAGSTQIGAIKNWLVQAGIFETGKGTASLTDLGKIMAAKDPSGTQAWTWWLFHLHLCANPDSFPYSAFFTKFDAEGTSWVSFQEVIDKLHQCQPDPSDPVERSTVESYFQGVERTFRAGSLIHCLGLVERRAGIDGDSRQRFRRALGAPADIVVAYATLLFHHTHFSTAETLETRLLI